MSHLLGLFVDKWLNIVANRTWTILPIWPHNWFRLNMPNEPILAVSYILSTKAKWLFPIRALKAKLALE